MAAPDETPRARLTPSISLIGKSLQLIRSYFEPLLWLLVIPVLIAGLGSQLMMNALPNVDFETWSELQAAVRQMLDSSSGQTGLLLMALGYLWLFVTYPASIILAHRAASGEPADSLTCLRLSWHYFVRIYLVTIYTALIVFAGLLLFIVPGLFLLRRYYLTPYELVRSDGSVSEAFRHIHTRTKPYTGYIWGLLGVTLLLSMVSSSVSQIPLFGFALSIAVDYIYFFAPALRYREVYEANPDVGKK